MSSAQLSVAGVEGQGGVKWGWLRKGQKRTGGVPGSLRCSAGAPEVESPLKASVCPEEERKGKGERLETGPPGRNSILV